MDFYLIAVGFGMGILIIYYAYHAITGNKTIRTRGREVYAFNYEIDKLGKKEREKKLNEFLNDKNSTIRSYASDILINNFRKFTINFREKQIQTISKDKNDSIRLNFSKRLPDFFEYVSEDKRNKLIENLAFDNYSPVRKYAARLIQQKFNKIPEKLKNLLLKFAEDQDADVRIVSASAVFTHFSYMSKSMREKLIEKLEVDENANVREKIIEAVKKHMVEKDEGTYAGVPYKKKETDHFRIKKLPDDPTLKEKIEYEIGFDSKIIRQDRCPITKIEINKIPDDKLYVCPNMECMTFYHYDAVKIIESCVNCGRKITK